jgi:glutathione synthase/RimK-type ligase-like ATP-grasp enzyme
MNKINIIVDYKNRFESKFTAEPYRSGFNKKLLQQYFNEFGFEVSYCTFPDIDFRNEEYKSQIFIYCSSEDTESLYKSYIEDVVLGLKLAGAVVIPDFQYLRAQNNKLFMEILRNLNSNKSLKKLHTRHFGSIEELKARKSELLQFPYVIKPAMGAMSEGVSCAYDFTTLIKNIKKISRSRNLFEETKDLIRRFRHRGYLPESRYRKKFILQEMIRNLSCDWKVLVFGEKFYVLKRLNRKHDFRASGSGLLFYERDLPKGLLDYAKTVFNSFNAPNLSIDLAFDGSEFYLIEFQSLYFGSYTLEHSDFYFHEDADGWKIVEEK